MSKILWDDIKGYDESIPFGCEEMDLGFKIKKHNSSSHLLMQLVALVQPYCLNFHHPPIQFHQPN